MSFYDVSRMCVCVSPRPPLPPSTSPPQTPLYKIPFYLSLVCFLLGGGTDPSRSLPFDVHCSRHWLHSHLQKDRKEGRQAVKKKRAGFHRFCRGITFICRPPSLVSPWLCVNPLPSVVNVLPRVSDISRVKNVHIHFLVLEVPRMHWNIYLSVCLLFYLSFFNYIPRISFVYTVLSIFYIFHNVTVLLQDAQYLL